MARGKLSSLFSEINGSIGGTIFQQGNSGQILRTKTKHTTVRNPFTLIPRHTTNAIQSAWAALTSSEKSEWESFAGFSGWKQKNNPSRSLNGFQCFSKINYYNYQYDSSIISTPTFSLIQPDAFTVDYALVVADLRGFFSYNVFTAGYYAVIFATTPLSAGVNNFNSKLKLICVKKPYSDEIDITSEYVNRFGHTVVSGDIIGFKTLLVDPATGIFTPSQTQKITIAVT